MFNVSKCRENIRPLNSFKFFVQDSWTPLFWAAKLNYRQITQLLVEQGADLNHRIVNVSVVVFLRYVLKVHVYTKILVFIILG